MGELAEEDMMGEMSSDDEEQQQVFMCVCGRVGGRVRACVRACKCVRVRTAVYGEREYGGGDEE